jgi:hypothetical protein
MIRRVGCLGGCLLPITALIVVIAAMKYILTTPDLSGMEIALVAVAALVVLGIAFFGGASHWTA